MLDSKKLDIFVNIVTKLVSSFPVEQMTEKKLDELSNLKSHWLGVLKKILPFIRSRKRGSQVISYILAKKASKAISKEKPIIPEKSREEIEAERKLRKALKAAKKVKAGTKDGVMNSETENTNDLSIKNMTSCVKNKANDAVKIDSGTDSVDGERILGKVSAVTTLPGIQMISVSKISSEKVENNTNGLSKSQLKAQRRELQEAQRAAKHAQGLLLKSKQDKENNSNGQEKYVEKLQPALSTEEKKAMPKLDLTTRTVEKTKKKVKFSALSFFSHLPIIEKDPKLAVKAFELCRIHQSFHKFGQDCANGLIRGGNARAIGLLTCLKLLIRSCEPV